MVRVYTFSCVSRVTKKGIILGISKKVCTKSVHLWGGQKSIFNVFMTHLFWPIGKKKCGGVHFYNTLVIFPSVLEIWIKVYASISDTNLINIPPPNYGVFFNCSKIDGNNNFEVEICILNFSTRKTPYLFSEVENGRG